MYDKPENKNELIKQTLNTIKKIKQFPPLVCKNYPKSKWKVDDKTFLDSSDHYSLDCPNSVPPFKGFKARAGGLEELQDIIDYVRTTGTFLNERINALIKATERKSTRYKKSRKGK